MARSHLTRGRRWHHDCRAAGSDGFGRTGDRPFGIDQRDVGHRKQPEVSGAEACHGTILRGRARVEEIDIAT